MTKNLSRKRFLSGLGAGAFGFLVISLGGWWFTIALGVIVHLALLEFFRMAQFTGIRPATKTTLVACQILLVTTQLGSQAGFPSQLVDAVLPLSGAAICGWLLLQPKTGSIADIAASIFGLFYLGFLPSHWLKLRNIEGISVENVSIPFSLDLSSLFLSGTVITILACLMIVGFDIGSYFVGRSFGSRQLSPISPGKTIEGVIGGLICSIIFGSITGIFIKWKFGIFFGMLLGFMVALFSLVGDLTESMMKRNAGLKDSGDVLPGHGGMLDRIDSYLFTPAVIFYTIQLFNPLLSG